MLGKKIASLIFNAKGACYGGLILSRFEGCCCSDNIHQQHKADAGRCHVQRVRYLCPCKTINVEEVAFLLLYGRLPRIDEFERFSSALVDSRELPDDLLDIFRSIPPKAHPMDVLSSAVAFLGTVDPEVRDHSREAVFRKTIKTIAKIPTIISSYWRISQHLEPIHPMRHLTHARNLLYMLSGYEPDEEAVDALDRMLILYAENEADVSSFTARVAASSFTDYHSALLAAIGSLKGRLHGGASEQVMRMLRNINEVCKAEEWVKDALQKKQLIMGFGDRVSKQSDARAQIMKNLSRELANKSGDTSTHILCEKIEEIVFREEGLHHNLNFYAGPILTMLSMPSDLCTPIFAAGRIAGWSAHIIEQLDNNKLVRPRFAYQGPKELVYQPFEARDNKIRMSSL
jgi:citrate synthase